jgi:hypothetical protein
MTAIERTTLMVAGLTTGLKSLFVINTWTSMIAVGD